MISDTIIFCLGAGSDLGSIKNFIAIGAVCLLNLMLIQAKIEILSGFTSQEGTAVAGVCHFILRGWGEFLNSAGQNFCCLKRITVRNLHTGLSRNIKNNTDIIVNINLYFIA